MNYKFLTEFTASGASKYYLTIIDTGEGDPNDYFFYVQANTTEIFRFVKSNTQVGKYTRNLIAGQHLISTPLILNNGNISNTLRTLKFDVAWYYDNTDLIDPWKSYNPLKPFNDLVTIDHTMGLWVNVTEDCNFTVAGVVPKITNVPLKTGWNLVGYPSFIDRNVVKALSSVNYARIEGYDPTESPHYLKLMAGMDLMSPGHGHWINVDSDQTWTVFN